MKADRSYPHNNEQWFHTSNNLDLCYLMSSLLTIFMHLQQSCLNSNTACKKNLLSHVVIKQTKTISNGGQNHQQLFISFNTYIITNMASYLQQNWIRLIACVGDTLNIMQYTNGLDDALTAATQATQLINLEHEIYTCKLLKLKKENQMLNCELEYENVCLVPFLQFLLQSVKCVALLQC